MAWVQAGDLFLLLTGDEFEFIVKYIFLMLARSCPSLVICNKESQLDLSWRWQNGGLESGILEGSEVA